MRTAITSDEQRSAVTQREGNTERGMRRLGLQVTKREQGMARERAAVWRYAEGEGETERRYNKRKAEKGDERRRV